MNSLDVISSEEYQLMVARRDAIDANIKNWWCKVVETIGQCEYVGESYETDICVKHNAKAVCPVNMFYLLMGHIQEDGSPANHPDSNHDGYS